MFGEPVAWFFVTLRDRVARGLLRLGISPNMLTLAGLIPSGIVGWLFAQGRFTAGAWVLLVAAAFDMLDGAVARLGGKITPFGGILDSTVDRVSDFFLIGGIAVWFAVGEAPGDAWRALYVTLSLVTLLGAFGTSYVRARSELAVEKCSVGFWERGERIAGIIIAAFSGHIETLVWVLAIFGTITMMQRLAYVWLAITQPAALAGTAPHRRRLRRLLLWEYRRLSPIYDITTASFIAVLIFVDMNRWVAFAP